MKLYKAKGQGIFINNPLNVIQMKYLDNNVFLVKYRDGDEIIVNKYNIIAEPKAKMKKISELINTLPKANDRIKNNISINDIQIGDIIEMNGEVFVVDNDVLNKIKDNFTVNILDILGDGSCIACYTFDNETADDLSGNYHGTWDGTEQYDIGKFGKAAKFDGSSSICLGKAENLIPSNSKFTISLWVKINEKVKTYDRILGTEYHNGGIIISRGYDGDNFSFLIGNGTDSSNYIRISLGSKLEDYFHHVVIGWNGSESFCYLDSNYVGNSPISSWSYANSSVNMFLGADANENGDSTSSELFIKGLIDQVRIFDKALTKEEVQKVYQESSKLIKKIV